MLNIFMEKVTGENDWVKYLISLLNTNMPLVSQEVNRPQIIVGILGKCHYMIVLFLYSALYTALYTFGSRIFAWRGL